MSIPATLGWSLFVVLLAVGLIGGIASMMLPGARERFRPTLAIFAMISLGLIAITAVVGALR